MAHSAASDGDDDDRDDDVDDVVYEAPTAMRVARRAVTLALVAFRGVIEADAADPGSGEMWREARTWGRELGLDDELEPAELAVIDAPLGSLPMQATIDLVWRSEGLFVLAWALGAVELEGLLQQCDPPAVANTIGFLADRVETVLADPHLRPASEIERLAEVYLALHWRLRHHTLGRGRYDFDALVAKNDWAPVVAGRIELVEGDLALDGVPLPNASRDATSRAMSVLQERHAAFEWLIGQHPTYSAIQTNT